MVRISFSYSINVDMWPMLKMKTEEWEELLCCGEGWLFAAGVLSSARRGERGGEERRGGVTSPVPRNILQTHLRLGTKLWTVSHPASWEAHRLWSTAALVLLPAWFIVWSPKKCQHFSESRAVVVEQLFGSAGRCSSPLGLMCLCLDARRWDIRNGESVGGDDARCCAVGR